MRINSKQLYILWLIIIFSLSCSSENRRNDFLIYKVNKTDFVNKLNVTGIIETTKTYTIACPRLRTDVTIVYLIPEGTHVKKGDTVCILEASELENKFKEAIKDLETAKSQYNKSVADLNLKYLLLTSQFKTIQSSNAISQLDSSKLPFTSPTQKKLIDLQIKKAEIEMEKIQNKLNFLKIINESELKKMKMKIKQAENNVARQKAQLNKLLLKSSTAGMATYATLWTTGNKIREGDIIWGTMPIIKIPDMSKMQIKLLVNEAQFKRIDKNQKVKITIDAFSDIPLTGKITMKTPMGRPIKKKSKVKMFDVFASIDSSEFTIQPGLSITCDVILESIPDTIVVPLLAVFEKDSSKIVYISEGEKFKRQIVNLASNSENFAVISEGLNENEEIILSEPPEDLITEGSQ
jgi:multidrug efflux pump subunit AcrA (membrane-fusion protein)